MKNYVVEDCQFSITVDGAVIGTGNVSITSQASTNSKVIISANVKKGIYIKKGIYTSPMSISVSGYSDSAISSGSGTGVINSTATNSKIDGQAIMLEGDSGEVVLSGTNPQSGSPVTGYTVTVKIISAGQSTTKGD